MSEETEIGEAIKALTSQIKELTERRAEAQKAGDGGRAAAAEGGITDTAKQLTELSRQVAELRGTDDKKASDEARKAEIEEAVKAVLKDTRSPSLAAAIGTGAGNVSDGRLIAQASQPPHPALKALFTDYRSGEIGAAFADMTFGMHALDFEMVKRGKAKLSELGMYFGDVPPESKATLGNTGAAGGYVLPNNLVDTVVKPNTQEAIYQDLVTVRNGVNVRGVDQPYRTGAPTRMTFQTWGATKENLDEAYGTYSAALGTIARIYDIGKQYLRFSAGSAEQDVMDELGRAAALGENYYILAGAGTGTGSSGDPTTGVYTAIVAGSSAYTTAGAPVAGTVAGSAAAQLATAFGALASRSRRPTAVVTDAVTYWSILSQGSDNAGFWMSELLGAGFSVSQDGTDLRWRGVPIRYDANFNTNTGTTKGAIVADWKTFKLYRGLEFRIDTSDVAGTRWDQNLVGFRGEEEIGFNASTGVSVGAAQKITGLIP